MMNTIAHDRGLPGSARGGVLLTAVILILSAGNARAQEHPEHPQEHPAEKPKTGPLTMDAFAKAAEAYIEHDSELKGGYFLVYDSEQKKPLLLKLDKVHREKLANTGDREYFACADFKTPEGAVYDLDIFMKGSSEADLVATEITIHKVGGKPRYTWFEDKGTWKKKPVAK